MAPFHEFPELKALHPSHGEIPVQGDKTNKYKGTRGIKLKKKWGKKPKSQIMGKGLIGRKVFPPRLLTPTPILGIKETLIGS